MLMELLEVEWDWCIYRLSDGQRRRVQLLLGLAKKKELLLLDEVTTDLDVVARQNLLNFLKEESEQVCRVSRVCVRGRSGFRV
jgi:CCR4-NOT complex subunit CAF16